MPASNLDLGPCIVVWDADGTPVIFDKTNGGVFFRYEELQTPIKEDQAGETDVDDVTTGAVNPTLEVPLTRDEVTDLVNVFSNASASVGGSNLKVANPVGQAVFASSKHVIAKPIINGIVSVDPEEWVHIYKAYPRVAMEQAYDNSGQRVIVATFKGYPSTISGTIGALWRFGDAAP